MVSKLPAYDRTYLLRANAGAAMFDWLKKQFAAPDLSLTTLSREELLTALPEVSSLQDLGNDYDQVLFLFSLLKDCTTPLGLRDGVFSALKRIGFSYRLQPEIDMHSVRLFGALMELGGADEDRYLIDLLGYVRNINLERLIVGRLQDVKGLSLSEILQRKAGRST